MAALPAQTPAIGFTNAFPPGTFRPLAVDTADDHAGFIVVVTAAFMSFALVSLIIRAYIQYSRGMI
ncbi:hypothetical protein FQN57_004889, partial [Myotisia sp. PD_48]